MTDSSKDVAVRHFFADLFSYTDGEVVIMLAFQASGTGSIPVQCILGSGCSFWGSRFHHTTVLGTTFYRAEYVIA